jgi:hypothetical protein
MRHTVLAVAAAILMAGCQPSAETPDSAPATPGDAPAPEMPVDAPPQEEVDPAVAEAPVATPSACREEIGQAAAERLVERCVRVSPATHPPCNVANPCEMIQGEIDRACAMYGPGETRPAECAA